MYDPRERLIQAIAATRRQKGRKMRTRQKDYGGGDQDLHQQCQNTIDVMTNELRSGDPDWYAIAESMADTLGSVAQQIELDQEDQSIIQDTADGQMVRMQSMGKAVGYSPFYDSVIASPAKPKLFDAIKKSLENYDPFWDTSVEEE